MRGLRIGKIYRYSKNLDPQTEVVDELPNFLFQTFDSKSNKVLMEAGINPIGNVATPNGARCPAILISSSAHKLGSRETPWHDEFDSDRGYARYFGDNKGPLDPESTPGNKALLRQFSLHTSGKNSDREKACPILLFESIPVGNRIKGNRLFQGVGVLTSAQRISQFQRHIGYFTNYVFELMILDLSAENDFLSWDWINLRRSKNLSDQELMRLAPSSWKTWVEKGTEADSKIRRRVNKIEILNKHEQLPTKGSREENCLHDVLSHYSQNKHGFELLASKVVASHVSRTSGRYLEGWVTRKSGDGGVDFVGRLDVGSGFSKVKIVVLGQAKCESNSSPTSGVHIARTVARLRRGWIGAFVTTSYFSDSLQRELVTDEYPLIMINGLQVAKELIRIVEKTGFKSVKDYLCNLDSSYVSSLSSRLPQEIIFD